MSVPKPKKKANLQKKAEEKLQTDKEKVVD